MCAQSKAEETVAELKKKGIRSMSVIADITKADDCSRWALHLCSYLDAGRADGTAHMHLRFQVFGGTMA